PAVGAVLLRRHPACKASFSALLSDITVENDAALVSDFLDACDIVLVPNSGVTIECLHKGKPTFYVSGTDEIEDDYYGFVADAILPRFDQELLQRGSDIAAWFDADWEARFARYDATIEKPIEQLKRDAGKAFLHLVEP
ncbi:hypothetical protein, partial [Sphingopyxis sp.]|uniref:hypothetical protein n=1 Tax=Sphingopyxis sp. TaxID=1908224 RepID=UPI002ED92119